MKAIRIWRTCFINVRARDSSLFYIKAIKVSRVERAHVTTPSYVASRLFLPWRGINNRVYPEFQIFTFL